MSILSVVLSLESADFVCPFGLSWNVSPARIIPSSGIIDQFNAMVRQIPDQPSDSETIRFLRSIAAQLQDLLQSSRKCSCRSRSAFEARMLAKLQYYIDSYLPQHRATKTQL